MDGFIGLMSGTSLDGVDGVVVDFPAVSAEPAGPRSIIVHAHLHLPMPAALRADLLALNQPGDNELHRMALAANALARLQADVVDGLLRQTGRSARDIRAIGSHGQTVRHRPAEFDGLGYTCQLNHGALLTELCGIDVICDFRSRDVAARGQGAPLAPAFHAAVFSGTQDRAVLNLGGIANLTLLPAAAADSPSPVRGFDCGPANALLDLWCQRHRGIAFDAEGRWAASGQVDVGLLARFLSEPYLQLDPPKSTGRDLFNAAWLDGHLAARGDAIPAADVQATLAELTARSVADGLMRLAASTRQLWVCGGGASNAHVMARLAALLPRVQVAPTSALGLPPDQVEACAFAWLARAFLVRHPGNLPEVTGALGARVLGALYPAT